MLCVLDIRKQFSLHHLKSNCVKVSLSNARLKRSKSWALAVAESPCLEQQPR